MQTRQYLIRKHSRQQTRKTGTALVSRDGLSEDVFGVPLGLVLLQHLGDVHAQSDAFGCRGNSQQLHERLGERHVLFVLLHRVEVR